MGPSRMSQIAARTSRRRRKTRPPSRRRWRRSRPRASASRASTTTPGAPAGRPTRSATSGRTTTSRPSTRRSASSARPARQLAAFTFNYALVDAPAAGPPCDTSNGGDPTVVYDPIGDRWIVADFAFTGDGHDAAVLRVHRRLQDGRSRSRAAGTCTPIRTDDAAHPWFPDYPKMGIWPDGLYMTANMFDGCCDLQGGARLGVQPRRPRVRRARCAQVVVDLEHDQLLQPAARATCAATAAAGRAAEPPRRASRRRCSRSRSSSSTPTTAAAARPSPGPTNVSQTALHRRDVDRSQPGATASTRWRAADDAGAVPQHRRHRVASGSTTRCRTSATGPAGIQWAQIDVTGGTIATTPVQQQIYGNVGERRPPPLDGQPRGRQERQHGARLQRRERDVEPGHPLRRPPRRPTRSNTLPQGETTHAARRHPRLAERATAAAAPASAGATTARCRSTRTAARSGTRTSTTRRPG